MSIGHEQLPKASWSAACANLAPYCPQRCLWCWWVYMFISAQISQELQTNLLPWTLPLHSFSWFYPAVPPHWPRPKAKFPPSAFLSFTIPKSGSILRDSFSFSRSYSDFPLKVTVYQPANTLLHLLLWSCSSGLSQEVALICFFF